MPENRLDLHKTARTSGGNPKSTLPRIIFHADSSLRSALAAYCRKRNAERRPGEKKTTESSACRELLAESLSLGGFPIEDYV